MHESISQLLRVQDVDARIIFLREAITARPREIRDEQRKLDQAQSAVKAFEERVKSLRIECDQREMDIRGHDAEMVKLNVALNQTKSNEEYSIIQAQIQKQKDLQGVAEEEVLEKLTQIDGLKQEIAAANGELAVVQKAYSRKEAEIAELVRGLSSQLEEVQKERDGLIVGIDPEQLKLYERVLERHKNFAIARVENQICQGCHMSLTPQEVNLLMQSSFLQCRSCSRLLYLDG